MNLDELSPEERQGRPLNPLLWGLGVALLSTVFAGVADLFSLNLPLMASILHTKSLLFGGMMGPLCQSSPVCHCLSAKTGSRYCQEKIRSRPNE